MEMENRLSRSSARGRKLYTKEGRKKSNRLPFLNELQRAVTSEKRSCTLLLLSQFTPSHAHVHTYYFTLKHTSRMHFLPILMCVFFFSLEFSLFHSVSAGHIFCFAPSLRDKPVELIASPSLPSSSAFLSRCVYDSVITLSSLRWPIILCSSGVMQRVLD